MEIRFVDEGDFNEVFRLLQQLWPGLKLDKEKQIISFKNTFADSREFGICAMSGNKMCGYCVVTTMNNYLHNGYTYYITIMIVDAEYRRKGVGKALIEEVKRLAVMNGIKTIDLDSGFHREEAHRFYESLGFEKECIFFSLVL